MNYYDLAEADVAAADIFPWQVSTWQLLWEAKQKNRLPHALLLTGKCDVEKRHFADEFAAALLCGKTNSEGKRCKRCHNCQLIAAQSHSDLRYILPEESSHIIKVDQIRDTVHFVNSTALQGGFRVIIIYPAHAMNLAATNALLKTLEEPTAHTLIILISDQNLRLAATISSRCHNIFFHTPPRELGLKWLHHQVPEGDAALLLNLAEGAPLKALAYRAERAIRQAVYDGIALLIQGKSNPLALAAEWQAHEMPVIFKLLLSWLRDIMRFKLTNGQAELINNDYTAGIEATEKKLSLENILKLLDCVEQNHKKVVSMPNLNKQLIVEETLIHWVRYVSS